MKRLLFTLVSTLVVIFLYSANTPDKEEMVIRIADLQIEPAHLSAYKQLLTKEATESVRLETGVICIFPMYDQQDSTRIRILEIYGNRQAYESHLKTPHFLQYKGAVSDMVISLELIDMKALDPEIMTSIFSKVGH
jgi:quinol monooxygenase YgiN